MLRPAVALAEADGNLTDSYIEKQFAFAVEGAVGSREVALATTDEFAGWCGPPSLLRGCGVLRGCASYGGRLIKASL